MDEWAINPSDELDAAAQAEIERWLRDNPLSEQLRAALLQVPPMDEARFRSVAAHIAESIEKKRAADAAALSAIGARTAPAVSDEKWGSVWNGIQRRVSQRSPATAPRRTPKALPRRRRQLFWLAATSMAAMLALALGVRFAYHAAGPGEDPATLELSSGANDRYEVSIEYAGGDPVVCYYLKP